MDNLLKSVSDLQPMLAGQGVDADSIRETKLKLVVERESMLFDPAIGINQETKKLRQSNFKYEYKIRQEVGKKHGIVQGEICRRKRATSKVSKQDNTQPEATSCSQSEMNGKTIKTRAPDASSFMSNESEGCSVSVSVDDDARSGRMQAQMLMTCQLPPPPTDLAAIMETSCPNSICA